MKTILTVDDERHMLCLLEFTLRKTGCRVIAVESGERALEAAIAHPIDLAVVDVVLPGIDGFETCRALRGLPEYGKLPAILLTARGQTHLRDNAAASHILFLTKPFSPLDLRRHVIGLLGLAVPAAG